MLHAQDMFSWSFVQPEDLKTLHGGSHKGLDWYWFCFLLDREVILLGLCNTHCFSPLTSCHPPLTLHDEVNREQCTAMQKKALRSDTRLGEALLICLWPTTVDLSQLVRLKDVSPL